MSRNSPVATTLNPNRSLAPGSGCVDFDVLLEMITIKLKQTLQITPTWVKVVISILGFLLLLRGYNYLKSSDPNIILCPDKSCIFYHNDNFAFEKYYRIKWNGKAWVDHETGDAIDVKAIAQGYGEATMKLRSEGFIISKSKPYIYIPQISSTGEKFDQITFFLEDDGWLISWFEGDEPSPPESIE